jgi:hypothetical protein
MSFSLWSQAVLGNIGIGFGDCHLFGVFRYLVDGCDPNDITTSFDLCRIVKLMMRKSRESMVNAHETSAIQNERRAVAVGASLIHLHQ